jgi:myo-inositol-1-phosphate synthase
MLVGWGGNNGSTVTACVLANKIKLKWKTKEGIKEANYYGSLTQASTTSLGLGPDGKDVYVPVKDLLPMLEPNDIEFDGQYLYFISIFITSPAFLVLLQVGILTLPILPRRVRELLY